MMFDGILIIAVIHVYPVDPNLYFKNSNQNKFGSGEVVVGHPNSTESKGMRMTVRKPFTLSTASILNSTTYKVLSSHFSSLHLFFSAYPVHCHILKVGMP